MHFFFLFSVSLVCFSLCARRISWLSGVRSFVPRSLLDCTTGAVIKAGDSKAEELADADVVLSIGNVALNNGVEGKPCKLWAAVEDEDGPQKVLLATLRTPHAEQAVLDITFPQGALLILLLAIGSLLSLSLSLQM